MSSEICVSYTDYSGCSNIPIDDTKGASTSASFGYTYDGTGNRTSEQTASGTTSYGYVALNRLTNASYPDGTSVSYAYDPTGNRTTMTTAGTTTTYTYNAGDELLSPGSETDTWDANGRLATKKSGATTTSYLQDLQTALPFVLAATTGGESTEYVYGKRLLEQVEPDGSHLFYHADALGSARVLTDDSGAVVATYDYDAFGAVRSQSGALANSFTFDGEQSDPESRLIFLRARYYDPTLGRFVSRDRASALASSSQALNAYAYTSNNPVPRIDPAGHDWLASANQWFSSVSSNADQEGEWLSSSTTTLKGAGASLTIAGQMSKSPSVGRVAGAVGLANDLVGYVGGGAEMIEGLAGIGAGVTGSAENIRSAVIYHNSGYLGAAGDNALATVGYGALAVHCAADAVLNAFAAGEMPPAS